MAGGTEYTWCYFPRRCIAPVLLLVPSILAVLHLGAQWSSLEPWRPAGQALDEEDEAPEEAAADSQLRALVRQRAPPGDGRLRGPKPQGAIVRRQAPSEGAQAEKLEKKLSEQDALLAELKQKLDSSEAARLSLEAKLQAARSDSVLAEDAGTSPTTTTLAPTLAPTSPPTSPPATAPPQVPAAVAAGHGDPAPEGYCLTWQRVAYPWYCENVAKPLWTEARVARVINATHAVIQVPAPPRCDTSKPSFDPTSPLTSYQDEGQCGARGDDAQANLSQCKHGAELVLEEENENFKYKARIKGCNYFAYKVYQCASSIDSPANGARPEADASMIVPLEENREVDFSSLTSAPRCLGFHQEEGKKIWLVLLGDKRFQKRYETQIQSLRCFVERNGYEMIIMTGQEFDECKKFRDYFFKKHCTVASWLATQSPNLVAAVVDADVVAAVLGRGLEKWAFHASDVQVYQRCLLPEIMAGNYMVRNTPFARKFLHDWAAYNFIMPRGFSSSDNGAIHLVVQETVQVVNFEKCKALYRGLTKGVTDLEDYWKFVKCSTDAIGPPRDWITRGGVLTVWPRLNFWATDGVYANKQAAREIGPVMHHGIKDSKDVLGHYYEDVWKCKQNANVLRSAAAVGQFALQLTKGYKEFFPQGLNCPGTAPHQCPMRCMRNFSCWPLRDSEKPLVQRTCKYCGIEP